MNIINKLTLRHLKLNKQRTIVTIIGVVLAVAMLTAVPVFVASFLDMMQRSVIADTGNWHVLYSDVPRQNIDIVVNDENTASAALSQDMGYARLDGSRNEDKPYLFLKSFDEQGFATYNLKLLEGRFPQKSSDIVISSSIAENGGVVYRIGDTIKLEIGQRHLEQGGNDLLLGQDHSYVEQSADTTGERFIPEYTREYTVTGIISPPSFEQYWAPGYTVIPFLDKNELAAGATVNISTAWQNVNKEANIHANELAEDMEISSDKVSYNRALLRYYGIIDDNLLSTLYSLAAFMIVLIIIGSVALIYNSFAISISERSRHLGMLASVGATTRQKRNSVFFEGLVVGIIGIPLGVFFGTLGMGITFELVQPLLTDVFKADLGLVVSSDAIISAVLLSMLTILISAYIPARRASRISPIDAIRQTQDVKLTGRTVKTSRLTRLIFGFEAELGLKNLKRHRRRYKVTIFSLVISIVLFLSVSSLSMLAQQSAELAAGSIPYDVSVFVTSSATAQEKMDFYRVITRMEHVDYAVIEQSMEAEAVVSGDLMAAATNPNAQSGKQEQTLQPFSMQFQIKAIDDAALNRYAQETGMDVTCLKDTRNPGGILFNTVTIRSADNKYTRMNRFNIEAGESLQFIHKINGEPGDYGTELQIIAVADKTPMGGTSLMDPDEAILFVSAEVYAAMQAKLPEVIDNTNVHMLIRSSDPSSLVEDIKEFQQQTSIANLIINDVAAANKRNSQVNTFINVFFYGFVLLMAAICGANILNTISTSVLLRRREFAVLKSVGMTPAGFNKMIRYESLFYGLKALFYGLPISFAMMYYFIYRSISNSFTLAFVIPWGSVIVAIIAILAMVSLTMLYAGSKIKTENIIDVLKNESI